MPPNRAVIVRERAEVHADAVGDQGLPDDVVGLEPPVLAHPDARARCALDPADALQERAGLEELWQDGMTGMIIAFPALGTYEG